MRIHAFIWPEERVEHIGRHGVSPEEMEQVCFGESFVRRAKSEGENPVYYVLGQTDAGRYLFCVVIRFSDGNGYPVTAREMTTKEAPLPKMETAMKTSKLPKTDSIRELAEFWDTHDLTDFEDELEEVDKPVFVRGSPIKVHLESPEAKRSSSWLKRKAFPAKS